MMRRRDTLKLISSGATLIFTGLLFPVRVLAKWNEAAFAATDYQEALTTYFPNQQMTESDQITIGVRQEIENGSVVPIKIVTELPDVESIAIFVEKNPTPLIANFDLTPACKGFVSTRIKVELPSDIIAVVKSDGKLFYTKTYIIVHEGGCA